MISTEDMGYYTKALAKELGTGPEPPPRYSFGPFDGRGIDLVLNFLLKKGLYVSFYAQGVKGFSGHVHGTSYETVVFKGVEPVARCERENYYESVTMAAVEALGLLKPVPVKARPNFYGEPSVITRVVEPEIPENREPETYEPERLVTWD